MAIIKCKMCGGDMELSMDKTMGMCEFCGSTMTLPRIDDEQRAAFFNRGNHFRRIGEFDKALQVYERIVRENDADAEAHWCCALCRFGIEYVEDPATYEWIPTCHRASFDSFLEDVDYLAAVANSDGITRRQYQKDAAKIAEVQRGILATSQNEEPYDVFICYKESDEQGNRTRDSILAQDIYYQLSEQGRKVFFARITLEDVAGRQYEPYIFAALNSAKVMIVVGTKPEHLAAVWVKNEWSRFLAMMKKDHSKLLLPCYRDMDPYDMPEQLSVLQSYDMEKIGFIQDLIRGVNKVLDGVKKPVEQNQTVVVQQQAAGNNMNALLKRGNMALEDGEWDRADGFFEEVLNQDAECADAYLGKLLAQMCVSGMDGLKDCGKNFSKNSNYQKVIRFGSREEMQKLHVLAEENQSSLLKRGNLALEERRWKEADAYFNEAITYDTNCVDAYLGKFCVEGKIRFLNEISDCSSEFWNTSENYRKLMEIEDDAWHDGKKDLLKAIVRETNNRQIYDKAIALVANKTKTEEITMTERLYGVKSTNKQKMATAKDYLQAAELLHSIPGYKDADEKGKQFLRVAEEIRQDEIYREASYQACLYTVEAQENAIYLFIQIKDWKDSLNRIEKCKKKIAEIEEKQRKVLCQKYKAENKCQYCGGYFKGVFRQVCTQCGKPKDY